MCRQEQVAELISQGLSNKQIANQLYISENTVKYHCKQLFRLYQVNCRTELSFKILNASLITSLRVER
jgi:DNA-binding NarL/FixJ family response regulator